MTADEIRKKYLEFFQSKGHKIIPSASLVPENDPTALFTSAGMQPLVPYLMGEKHPSGDKLTDCQKCVRTSDIDEVGDATHHTFFEMLGNWSLGAYFKKEAVEMSWEFLTSPRWLNLDKNRIAVSVFAGDENAPFDEEAFNIWKNIFEKNNLPIKRIAKLPRENNWWGPAGEIGPCGPDTEMFYWSGDKDKTPISFNDDNNLWVEIWNDVFMEYEKKLKNQNSKIKSINQNSKLKENEYEFVKLKQRNVDTGMGLERITTAINNLDDNYKTELFWPIIEKIEELSPTTSYQLPARNATHSVAGGQATSYRIIADHLKAATFLIADGIEPSNVQRGYVLRRLVRRAIRHGYLLEIKNNFTAEIAKIIQDIYKDTYPKVNNNKILGILTAEEEKFRKTLENGLKEFDKLQNYITEKYKNANELNYLLDGKIAFNLYQTYGFPLEMFFEELNNRQIVYIENKVRDSFNGELKKHQQLSRTASAGMFKGGLADARESTTKLHTTAHLMLAGLRKVLGNHVIQRGSNITAERLRFDFSHPEKMTEEQKKAVENFVNEAIQKNIPVKCEEMTLAEAKKQGAMGAFENKYGDRVKVYTIDGYSKEICGGPHVKNTGDIGGVFKIKKEESSSAGVRRIKAIIE